jgi:hypothetical protein
MVWKGVNPQCKRPLVDTRCPVGVETALLIRPASHPYAKLSVYSLSVYSVYSVIKKHLALMGCCPKSDRLPKNHLPLYDSGPCGNRFVIAARP